MLKATRVRTTRTCALLILSMSGVAGCEPGVRDEFRAAALGSIQTGINAILQGIVDGAFAVAEPETEDDTSGGDTGGDTATP